MLQGARGGSFVPGLRQAEKGESGNV
jgi:hypothetical protein